MPEPRSRPFVLLTGFEPFPNNPINATEALVPALAAAGRRSFPDVRFATEILPTQWHVAPHRMQHLLAEMQPDILLGFGISSRANRFTIETRGINWRRDSRDAAGVEIGKGRLIVGGPVHLPARLPVANIVGRLRRRGIAVRISRDAGGYLCNAALYHGLLQAAHVADLKHIGFVHVPADLPVPRTRRTGVTDSCPATWDQMMLGGLEIIGACLGRTADRARPH